MATNANTGQGKGVRVRSSCVTSDRSRRPFEIPGDLAQVRHHSDPPPRKVWVGRGVKVRGAISPGAGIGVRSKRKECAQIIWAQR